MSSFMKWQVPVLTDAQFEQFALFIYETCGIRLSVAKKTMLTSRLIRRLRVLSMHSFDEYYRYVTGQAGGDELLLMIDAVSTNKTDFFREDSHFSCLTDIVVPTLLKTKVIINNCLHIWSAGCSSGEEPYTMGMVLSEFAREHSSFDFKITGSDISTRVLDMARTGIYKDSRVAQIPVNLVHRYLLRGEGKNKGYHRVVPELQRKVRFKRLNFIDETFSLKTLFDVVFCRNVMIYFDRKTQQSLFKKFYDHLKPGGFFFLGHSEVMSGMEEMFEKIEPTIYRRI
jgi:chemotaxis protein methyltransferase CheR